MKILRGKYKVRTSHGHEKELHHDGTNWLGLAIGESIIEHTLLESHDTPNFGVSDTTPGFDVNPPSDSFSGGGSDSGFGGGGASGDF